MNYYGVHFRNVISEVEPIDTLTEGVGREEMIHGYHNGK